MAAHVGGISREAYNPGNPDFFRTLRRRVVFVSALIERCRYFQAFSDQYLRGRNLEIVHIDPTSNTCYLKGSIGEARVIILAKREATSPEDFAALSFETLVNQHAGERDITLLTPSTDESDGKLFAAIMAIIDKED